jgi:hypothetical protein
VLDADVGAHRPQALDVLIDRTRADRAAAGQRHPSLAEARQQRAQHQDRRAHRLHQFVRRLGRRERRRVDLHLVGLRGRAFAAGTHVAQQLQRRADVLQPRHVGQGHRGLAQQRRAQPRQRGVLGARDHHLALEAAAAANQQFVHG